MNAFGAVPRDAPFAGHDAEADGAGVGFEGGEDEDRDVAFAVFGDFYWACGGWRADERVDVGWLLDGIRGRGYVQVE